MNRMLQVVDTVLASAKESQARAQAETTAVKEAAAQPRTQIARDLRSLASSLTRVGDDV